MAKDQPTREPLKGGITRLTYASGKVMYEARWTYVDSHNTRRYRRKALPTLKQAKAHKARMDAAIAEQRYDAPTSVTVAEYAEVWFRRRERDWASSTTNTNRRLWRLHVEPVFGARRLSAVTRHQCQVFVDQLAQTHKPSSVNGITGVLRGILSTAVLDGLISRNVAEALDLPSKVRAPRIAWTEDEVEQFLDATRTDRYYALYALILATGCRIGEALALQWSRVDLDAGTVTFAATLRLESDTSQRTPAPGTKNGTDRTIPLTHRAIAALREHRERQLESRRKAKAWDIRNFVFTRREGLPMIYEVANRHLQVVQRRLGPGWRVNTFHGMRHTVPTILMRRNVHPAIVQEILGHKSITVTLDTYTHVSANDLVSAVQHLDPTYDNTGPDQGAKIG